MVRWYLDNFRCRGVLLIWKIAGQGLTALAVGVDGLVLDICVVTALTSKQSLSGVVVVVNNIYPLRLTEFFRDEIICCDETSHKHASWHSLNNSNVVCWPRSDLDLPNTNTAC